MNAARYLTRDAAKATTGALAAFASAVAGGYVDGAMTPGEWWAAAAAALIAFGVVWRVPNDVDEGDEPDQLAPVREL